MKILKINIEKISLKLCNMSKYITISEIYSKIKSKDDICNYFREQGEFILI